MEELLSNKEEKEGGGNDHLGFFKVKAEVHIKK
jgi:hypothetical protein